MIKFDLTDRYRLELHWKKAVYEQDGRCKLIGAYFSGPALAEAEKINDVDFLMMDFFSQYIILVKSAYVAKLSWGGVVYNKEGTVGLKKVFVTHDTELNRVPKFKSGDHLIIDTHGHDVKDHAFNLVYKTYVVNEDTALYKFGG